MCKKNINAIKHFNFFQVFECGIIQFESVAYLKTATFKLYIFYINDYICV